MSYGYIYKTTNTLNDKIYIGQKKGRFEKWYMGSGVHIQRSLKKNGKDKFKLEIITYADSQEQLDELEKKFILEYRNQLSKDKLYNISNGGQGVSRPPSEETKKKMSLSHIGLPRTEEHIENWIESRRRNSEENGYWHKKETKQKIGEVHKNTKWMSKHGKSIMVKLEKINDFIIDGWVMGRQPFSDIARKRMSESAIERCKK